MHLALRECGGEHADAAIAARDAAIYLLRHLMAAERSVRADALDLLSADALMTYACEAACDDPATLGAFARDAAEMVLALTPPLAKTSTEAK